MMRKLISITMLIQYFLHVFYESFFTKEKATLIEWDGFFLL